MIYLVLIPLRGGGKRLIKNIINKYRLGNEYKEIKENINASDESSGNINKIEYIYIKTDETITLNTIPGDIIEIIIPIISPNGKALINLKHNLVRASYTNNRPVGIKYIKGIYYYDDYILNTNSLNDLKNTHPEIFNNCVEVSKEEYLSLQTV